MNEQVKDALLRKARRHRAKILIGLSTLLLVGFQTALLFTVLGKQEIWLPLIFRSYQGQ